MKPNKKLIFILILTFLVVYSPHFNYEYPIHADEWEHIDQSRKLFKPNYNTGMYRGGYHFLLYLIDIPFDLVRVHKFLPAIFAVFSSICLFILVKKIENEKIALLSCLLFIFLPTTNNLLGTKFATSISLTFGFIYLYFYNIIRFKEEDKGLLSSLILLLILLLIYPPAFFIVLIPTVIYLSNKTYIFISIFTAVTLYGIYINKLVFLPSTPNTSTPLMLGGILILLAIIGFKKHPLLKIAIYTMLLNILFFYITNTSLFARWQRLLYFFFIIAIIYSAIGVNRLMNFFYLKRTFLLVVILLCIANHAYYYKGYYYLFEDEDYEALNYLGEQAEETRVIAPLDIAKTVYTISGNNAIIDFHSNSKLKEEVNTFFMSNCTVKNATIKKRKVDYVYSFVDIDCGWNEIYNNTRYIYET